MKKVRGKKEEIGEIGEIEEIDKREAEIVALSKYRRMLKMWRLKI